MPTYRTLDGQTLDLRGLTAEERAFLDSCVAAYRRGAEWVTLSRMVEGRENPLVRATDGWITATVSRHPLFRAVSDLEDRLGIAQGYIAPAPHDDPSRDPFVDGWVPVAEASAH